MKNVPKGYTKPTQPGVIRRRLSEPSTWAGLALIASQGVTAWTTRDYASMGATLGGLAAVLLPERKAE